MKKKVISSLLSVVIIVVVFVIVYIVRNYDGDGRSSSTLVSSGFSFGDKEDDEIINQYWIYDGCRGERLVNCNIICNISNGGLVLTLYDNNGYSRLDNDKFVVVREEIITQSGEYNFDFTDLSDGIYSLGVKPQNIGDKVRFDFTIEIKDVE